MVVDAKEKQDNDPILLELKNAVHNQRVEVFFQGGDGVLRYQDRLCVPDVGELRKHILVEAHYSRYSIHLGATKMYHDLRGVYSWNDMKRDIADFVSKFPNCRQVKVEHQKPEGYYSRDRYSYLEVRCKQYGLHHRIIAYSQTAWVWVIVI